MFLRKTLFPDDAYTIKGLMLMPAKNGAGNADEARMLLSQPFVADAKKTSDMKARAAVYIRIRDMGFEPFESIKTGIFYKGSIALSDLHEANVLYDSNKNLRFIDPYIELMPDTQNFPHTSCR